MSLPSLARLTLRPTAPISARVRNRNHEEEGQVPYVPEGDEVLEDEDCSICLGPLADSSERGRAARACDNDHIAHVECLRGVRETSPGGRSRLCPGCRAPMHEAFRLTEEDLRQRRRQRLEDRGEAPPPRPAPPPAAPVARDPETGYPQMQELPPPYHTLHRTSVNQFMATVLYVQTLPVTNEEQAAAAARDREEVDAGRQLERNRLHVTLTLAQLDLPDVFRGTLLNLELTGAPGDRTREHTVETSDTSQVTDDGRVEDLAILMVRVLTTFARPTPRHPGGIPLPRSLDCRVRYHTGMVEEGADAVHLMPTIEIRWTTSEWPEFEASQPRLISFVTHLETLAMVVAQLALGIPSGAAGMRDIETDTVRRELIDDVVQSSNVRILKFGSRLRVDERRLYNRRGFLGLQLHMSHGMRSLILTLSVGRRNVPTLFDNMGRAFFGPGFDPQVQATYGELAPRAIHTMRTIEDFDIGSDSSAWRLFLHAMYMAVGSMGMLPNLTTGLDAFFEAGTTIGVRPMVEYVGTQQDSPSMQIQWVVLNLPPEFATRLYALYRQSRQFGPAMPSDRNIEAVERLIQTAMRRIFAAYIGTRDEFPVHGLRRVHAHLRGSGEDAELVLRPAQISKELNMLVW